MKLGKIADIYNSLQKVSKFNIPLNESYKIHKLIVSMKDDCEFYIKKELEILRKYGNESEFLQGHFAVPTKNISLCRNEIDEVRNTEIDFQIKYIIQIPLNSNYQLSANDIGALISFVEFIEMEENDNVDKD